MYAQYPQQQQQPQNAWGQQFGMRPPKPPSTKIEGFPLMHFSAFCQLTTIDEKADGSKGATLWLLAPFLNSSSAFGSLSNPEDYSDVVAPYNMKLKVANPEVLKPRQGFSGIRDRNPRPYAFIAALQPDSFMSQGNKFPMWKGHIVVIANSFDAPEMRNALWLPGQVPPAEVKQG